VKAAQMAESVEFFDKKLPYDLSSHVDWP
jgi:hypothetical protein